MPSVSKSQQRLMGMVYAYQKGNLKKKDVKSDELWDKIKNMSKTIKKKDSKDFATTKHKKLPEKIKEYKIYKYSEFKNEDLEFEFKEENEKLTFHEAFEKYIKGQKIKSEINAPIENRYIQASGILCENGYKYVSYGGGCSGEDCNSTYILDFNNKIIASDEW